MYNLQVPPGRWKLFPERGVVRVSWPVSEFYTSCNISATANAIEASNFVHLLLLAMWSLSLVTSECSLSGRGRGHVSNSYIVDLENYATARRRYTGEWWYTQLVRGRFVYDTYRTMEATRSPRHGWVHMCITHCPTVTLQLHNFDFFRTCRTSSFCTVVW